MRELFTESEITEAYQAAAKEDTERRYSLMAKRLTDKGRGPVSRQMARNWSLTTAVQDDTIAQESDLEVMRQRRQQQVSNNKLRKRERVIMDAVNEVRNWKEGFNQAVERICSYPHPIYKEPIIVDDGTGLTLEVLISDVQFGKVDKHYNTTIARRRVREIARMAIFKAKQYQGSGYTVERVVVSLMGDMIESADKHPDSALACDSSTPEQMSTAIESLHKDLIVPIAQLGIPMDVYCVGGNHDSSFAGMSFFKAGRTLLSYPIYYSLSVIADAQGLSHINYVIPETAYTLYNIYESTVLVEHGVKWSNTDTGMRTMKSKRAEQLGLHIDMCRIGHLHSAIIYNAGQHICNGATFGSGDGGYEYSSSVGYSSEAAQFIIAHCPKGKRRSTTFEITTVQLGHIR